MFYYFMTAVLVSISNLSRKSIFRSNIYALYLLFCMFCLILAVNILRPLGDDMPLYLRQFEISSSLKLFEALSLTNWEPGFVFFQWLLAQFTTSKIVFIGVSTFLICVLVTSALKKLVLIRDLPLIIFSYLNFFYFYNFTGNVIRQGVAVSIILLMISYLGNSNFKKSLVFFLTAISFHLSAIIAVILFIVKKFNISVRFLLIFYFFSSLLMIIGINQIIMQKIAGLIGGGYYEALMVYSSEAVVTKYGAVNRLDFLFFTTIWVFWGLWFYKRYFFSDPIYKWLLKSYLALGSIYILFGFIGYSDRIASYAWFLIPILLSYPAVKLYAKKRWLTLCMLISISLFFYFNIYYLYEPLKLLY